MAQYLKQEHVQPACWVKKCPVSDAMIDGFEVWVDLVFIINAEVMSNNGFARDILKAGGLLDPDILVLLAELSSEYSRAVNERIKRERESSRQLPTRGRR